MRLLIDCVFFQLASSGIARVWASLIPRIVSRGDIDVYLLDRGKTPLFEGATYIPFPAYKDRYSADDSILIQKICDHYSVDVFTTTYYTSPMTTPMLLVVYDMIPEKFAFDLQERMWREKQLAICYARSHVCISSNTKKDLIHFYPEIDEASVVVAYPGVDHTVFKPLPLDQVERFRASLRIERPYMLIVGSREQHKGYKNSRIFFKAVSEQSFGEFDILCVGGEEDLDEELVNQLPSGMKIQRVSLDDQDLALAYNGALALVYPSLYEGFGLPVIEATACGCTVITTEAGSLREVISSNCITVGGLDVNEMVAALRTVINGNTIRAMSTHSAVTFSWENMASILAERLKVVYRQAGDDKAKGFENKWRVLREIQACVDIDPLF